jgi:hypothetical protein
MCERPLRRRAVMIGVRNACHLAKADPDGTPKLRLDRTVASVYATTLADDDDM